MIDIQKREHITLRDKRVTVIGLGISGVEAAKLANYHGARVFASDLSSSEMVNSHAMDLMHKHHIPSETGVQSDKIYDADLWVLSPGISKNNEIVLEAIRKGVPIVGEIEFASWFTDSPIIAITGSNGKTTTAHILSEMCQNKDINGVMAGNMGLPFSERVLNETLTPDKNRLYILEVSSFQMEFTKHFSPDFAVFTNISQDHLDRHNTMKEYIQLKMDLAKNLKKEGFIIYNRDDNELHKALKNSPSQKQSFSINSKETLFSLDNNIIVGPSKTILANVKDLKVYGEHNIANLFAAATCSFLIGVPENNISNTLKEFQGVEHRLEHVKFINNVEFVNDSKATNIQSVKVAIDSYNKPIILILGGYNKGADFRLLLPHIKSSNVRDIVSYGDAGGQINTALGDAVSSVQVTDLNSAVKKAHSLATPGDIVLLSPGCASFDQFPNFEVRGNFYKSVVRNEL